MKITAPQGGALLVFLTLFILGSVNHPNAQTLPVPWVQADVGSPAAQGQSGVASGTFSLAGAGQIGGTADSFHFVYQRVSGDVDLIVRADSLQNVDPWTKAGVMIRDGLGASVRHAYLSVSAGHGVNFERRRSSGGGTSLLAGGGGVAPVWLRLVRTGSDFAAFRSSNGTSWTLIGRDTIAMPDAALVGLAVASDLPTRTATAVFSNVTVGIGGSLPSPWLTDDVGSIQAGSATLASGVFTIKGAGSGMAGTSDQFRYVFQAMSGDIEITAKLATFGSTSVDAMAGATIRAGLGASAAHATMLGTVASGWEFRRRVAAGGKTIRTAGSSGRAPGWIRIVREGDLVSAFYSSDGGRWTLVDSDRITMPATVYVGLAVSSDTASKYATATFDSLLIRKPATTNEPPEIAILNPVSGTSYAAGASITVQATAADPDGVIAGVEFYRDSTLIASDATAPFAATWSAATSGTHLLAAVARDADGAASVTTAVVFVGSGGADQPGTLRFVPSADHAKNVDSYVLTVYRATDPLTATPLKKSNLGKPAPVDGEIAVDVSSTLSALPAGTYRVVVTAINSVGSTPSLPSQFDK